MNTETLHSLHLKMWWKGRVVAQKLHFWGIQEKIQTLSVISKKLNFEGALAQSF